MPHEETERLIRRARVSVASPENVAAELREYGKGLLHEGLYYDEDLEKILLGRNEPLIDLGLARFAGSKETLATLYRKGSSHSALNRDAAYNLGLRAACLSNEIECDILPEKFPDALLGEKGTKQLLAEGAEEEVWALVSNPRLDESYLVQLYRNEGFFAELAEERRQMLVAISAYNPRLVRKDEGYDMPDLQYWDIQKSILHMLGSVPVTEHWFVILEMLLGKLNPFMSLATPDEPVTPVLERWSKLQTDGDGLYTALSRTEEFRCLIAAFYGRFHDSKTKESGYAGHSDSVDVAARCAYYANAKLSENEVREGIERDEDVFVFAAACNGNVLDSDSLAKILEDSYYVADLYLKRRKQRSLRWRQFSAEPVTPGFDEEDDPASPPMRSDGDHRNLFYDAGKQRIYDAFQRDLKRDATISGWTAGATVIGLAIAGVTAYRVDPDGVTWLIVGCLLLAFISIRHWIEASNRNFMMHVIDWLESSRSR